MKSTRTSLSSRPGSTASSTKQLSRPSSKLSSTKTYSAPSFKFSYQKKIFTNQKSFSSALLVHISGKKQVVSVGSNKLSLWDLNTFKLLSSLQVNDFEVHNLCYLENAGLLIGSSWKSRELRIWSLKNGELRPHSRKKFDFTPMCSVSFRKNDIVCTASMGKDLLFWSSCSGKVYSRFCIENGLEIRAMTPVEKRSCVAVGCKDGTVLLVNYLKKQVVMSYRLPLKLIIIMDLFVPFLAYSSSMDLLFAGSCNSNIEVLKVIDKPDKKYLSPVSHKMQLEGVRGLSVLDDEKAVLTCHDNQFLRIWNMQNLQTSEAIAAKVSQAFSMSVDTKTKQVAIADFQAASFAVLNYCITK